MQFTTVLCLSLVNELACKRIQPFFFLGPDVSGPNDQCHEVGLAIWKERDAQYDTKTTLLPVQPVANN